MVAQALFLIPDFFGKFSQYRLIWDGGLDHVSHAPLYIWPWMTGRDPWVWVKSGGVFWFALTLGFLKTPDGGVASIPRPPMKLGLEPIYSKLKWNTPMQSSNGRTHDTMLIHGSYDLSMANFGVNFDSDKRLRSKNAPECISVNVIF